jgi:hypothetical protein
LLCRRAVLRGSSECVGARFKARRVAGGGGGAAHNNTTVASNPAGMR